MRIHTDPNGLYVNAISRTAEGKEVNGQLYNVVLSGKTGALSYVNLQFQSGPYPEVGAEGLTTECLLDVLIHRVSFQDSKFPCAENASAILGLKSALIFLNERTSKRKALGVEGKHVL
jgi:hypothetical protein